MTLFSLLIFLLYASLRKSDAFQCSYLHLTSTNTNNDNNYAIVTERLTSPNIIKVSLIVKQVDNSKLWFIMGASDFSKLIGTWQPFSTGDGQIIDCSSYLGQAVTNENSFSEDSNQLEYIFYWMSPPSFSGTVIFVATITENYTTNDKSSIQYIQSIPIEIEQAQGRQRYYDVNPGNSFDL